MMLQDETEVAATREKMCVLQSRYESLVAQPAKDAHVRELTLHSLKRMIHQMQEELARYHAHASVTNA